MTVQFDESSDDFGLSAVRAENASGMTALVLKTGVVTTKSQAEKVLLGLAAAVFAVSSLIFFTRSGAQGYNPTPAEKAEVNTKVNQIESNLRPPNR